MNISQTAEVVARAVFDRSKPHLIRDTVATGLVRGSTAHHPVELSVELFEGGSIYDRDRSDSDVVIRLTPEEGKSVETVLPLEIMSNAMALESAWALGREIVRRNDWNAEPPRMVIH